MRHYVLFWPGNIQNVLSLRPEVRLTLSLPLKDVYLSNYNVQTRRRDSAIYLFMVT